jgi:hypothetical protein
MEKLEALPIYSFPMPNDLVIPETLLFRENDDYFGEVDITTNAVIGRGRKFFDNRVREGFWDGDSAFPIG